MTPQPQVAHDPFTTELLEILDETFEHVRGIFLDKQTSLFETLATISAAEASQPVGGRCATLAAQVNHVCFYLDVIERSMKGEEVGNVDWDESWQIAGVGDEEWASLKQRLRDSHQRVLATIRAFDSWDGENRTAGALAILAHTAYHLGEIRQALCTVKS